MVFKFYQLYRSMKEVIGLEEVKRVFPEYDSLDDKMSKEAQIEMARILMDRLDEKLDSDTVFKIRMKHPCNIPKQDKAKINQIKQEYNNDIDRLKSYCEYLNASLSDTCDNEYIITWQNKECVCGMFRNVRNYKSISPTWCICCNGNNKLQFDFLFDKNIKSKLVEGICSGGKTCSFKIEI